MAAFDLIVFDMAGTTVRDRGEVSDCFLEAAEKTGVKTTPEEILAMMGWSKRYVFEVLLKKQLGEAHPEFQKRVDKSYDLFRKVLENYYASHWVSPTDGCLICFNKIRKAGIPMALTTGFYRKVTNIILRRLGWDEELRANYLGYPGSLIQASIASDEVPNGRPAPDMIFRAMNLLGVRDPKRVVNIGDTPSDLQSGRAAGCGLSLGVTNGTHTREQLEPHPNDDLLGSLNELPGILGLGAN